MTECCDFLFVRLCTGSSADTRSLRGCCPSSLTPQWTWTLELVRMVPLTALPLHWVALCTNRVCGCVCVPQAPWRWLPLTTTWTSRCPSATRCHASLWLEEMEPWRPSVETGCRCTTHLYCAHRIHFKEYLHWRNWRNHKDIWTFIINSVWHWIDCLMWYFAAVFSVCSGLGVKGVKRFDARHLVVNALIDKQLFRGTQSHAMTLPVCRH